MSCQLRLWDKRLSIAELTEQQLKRNVEFDEEKRKMEMQILQVELELKKEQLKKNEELEQQFCIVIHFLL
jgi:hypothetical protein